MMSTRNSTAPSHLKRLVLVALATAVCGALAAAVLVTIYVDREEKAAAQRMRGPHTAVGGSVQRLVEVTFEGVNGEEQSLSDLIGGRRALLYFFLGCCDKCQEQLSRLEEVMDEADERDLAVIGIEYAAGPVCRIVHQDDYRIPGTVIADPHGDICEAYRVSSFTIITADKQGRILGRGRIRDREVLKRFMEGDTL